MKKLTTVASLAIVGLGIFSLASCGSTTSSAAASTTTAKKNIGILQIITHDALGKARQGFVDELAAQGWGTDKVNINTQIPEGDSSTETSMAANLASSCDLVLGIATSSALALKSAVADLGKNTIPATSTKDNLGFTPVLFTAVTDPVASGLVTSFTDHGNVVGTSDNVPTEKNIELFKDFGITSIGTIYNTAEQNSQIQVKEAKAACEKFGIAFNDGGVTSTTEIETSLQGLIAKGIKGLFLPTDNMVASAMSNIKDTIVSQKIVTVCADGNMASETNGGSLGFGVNYYTLGQQTGKMAADILNGTAISTISCAVSSAFPLTINHSFFTSAGISIPESVSSQEQA